MRKPFLRNPFMGVWKFSQLWQDHCTMFLGVIQRSNRSLLDVEYMWGLEQKGNALCPCYIYCDYIQIITAGKLSWINFWYKALILSSFPKDLLQATTTTKKQFLRNYCGRKAGTWNEFWIVGRMDKHRRHLLLHKCFSLLFTKTSVKNDTSEFIYHPLDCVSCQRPSLNLPKKKRLKWSFSTNCSYQWFLDLFWKFHVGFPGVASRSDRVPGTLWGDTQRLVAPRQLRPRGFSVVPRGSGGFSRQWLRAGPWAVLWISLEDFPCRQICFGVVFWEGVITAHHLCRSGCLFPAFLTSGTGRFVSEALSLREDVGKIPILW